MSTALTQWGHLVVCRPLLVLIAWVMAIGVVVGTQTPVISTTLTLADSPAQEVLDTVTAEMPDAAGDQGMLVLSATPLGRRRHRFSAAGRLRDERNLTRALRVLSRPNRPPTSARTAPL